jgi:hypothetical protein
LDDSDIGAAFEQMGGEAVAQRMERHALLDPGRCRPPSESASWLIRFPLKCPATHAAEVP